MFSKPDERRVSCIHSHYRLLLFVRIEQHSLRAIIRTRQATMRGAGGKDIEMDSGANEGVSDAPNNVVSTTEDHVVSQVSPAIIGHLNAPITLPLTRDSLFGPPVREWYPRMRVASDAARADNPDDRIAVILEASTPAPYLMICPKRLCPVIVAAPGVLTRETIQTLTLIARGIAPAL